METIEPLVCWKCGQPLDDVIFPISRRDVCRHCSAELHVCRLCESYDPRVAGQCREDRAEDVTDKERANFCDYFAPRPGAYEPRERSKAEAAKAELEALFGMGPGKKTEPAREDTEAERARAELERLFGMDGNGADDQKKD